jgi:uncharacterized membrane protein YsdA (DUF1294 family)
VSKAVRSGGQPLHVLPALALSAIFLAAVGALTFAGLPRIVPAVYLAFSAVAYAAYGLDKRAAERGTWRTREATLHVLALFGGWPGALVAQRVFRHKSRKTSFQLVFWGTVAVNCLALVLLARMSTGLIG